jgi:hypothetical protein
VSTPGGAGAEAPQTYNSRIARAAPAMIYRKAEAPPGLDPGGALHHVRAVAAQAQPTQVSWFVQGAKYVSGSGHG